MTLNLDTAPVDTIKAITAAAVAGVGVFGSHGDVIFARGREINRFTFPPTLSIAFRANVSRTVTFSFNNTFDPSVVYRNSARNLGICSSPETCSRLRRKI